MKSAAELCNIQGIKTRQLDNIIALSCLWATYNVL